MPQLPESLSQAGLQFTLATEEDFDDIMAMSQDIYGGLDYLPTRYSSWLKEANRTVILARKQGKVVRQLFLQKFRSSPSSIQTTVDIKNLLLRQCVCMWLVFMLLWPTAAKT